VRLPRPVVPAQHRPLLPEARAAAIGGLFVASVVVPSSSSPNRSSPPPAARRRQAACPCPSDDHPASEQRLLIFRKKQRLLHRAAVFCRIAGKCIQSQVCLMHLITSWSGLCSGLFAWKIISDSGRALWVISSSREAPCPIMIWFVGTLASETATHFRWYVCSPAFVLLPQVHRDNSPCTKVLLCCSCQPS